MYQIVNLLDLHNAIKSIIRFQCLDQKYLIRLLFTI